MFTKLEEQLIRAAMAVERQNRPLTAAAIKQALGYGKDQPGTDVIEDFVWYWQTIFDMTIHQKASRPPFPFQLVFLYLARHSHTEGADLAQVLGFASEFAPDDMSDWILGQTLKKKAATVVQFWGAYAEKISQTEEMSVGNALSSLLQRGYSPEEEQEIYQYMRVAHLANILAQQIAGTCDVVEVKRLAREGAERCLRTALPCLQRYVASLKDVEGLFEEEFRIILTGEPTPAQQGQELVEQVITYLRTHHRADPDALASLLQIDRRDVALLLEVATKQLLASPDVVRLRNALETIGQQFQTREHVPEGHELYCLYNQETLMRVSDLCCDKQGIAVTLEDGKQGFFIEWTHVTKLEQLERSLGWRVVSAIEAPSQKGEKQVEKQVLPDSSGKLETLRRSLDTAPTISGWLAIGQAILTGEHQRSDGQQKHAPPEAQPAPQEPQKSDSEQASSASKRDLLAITLDALQRQPDLSDEQLALLLSLSRPASARFWRLKAQEMLHTGQQKQTHTSPDLNAARAAVPMHGREQTADLPFTASHLVAPHIDALARQAAGFAEEWCRAQIDQQAVLKGMHLYPCSSRLFQSTDRIWIAKPLLEPIVEGYTHVMIAWRSGQFAALSLGTFVTSLTKRLETAWHQRGYSDAKLLSWSRASLEHIQLPFIRNVVTLEDVAWVATIRVAFRHSSEVHCVVWLHHITPESLEIRVVNTPDAYKRG